MAARTKPSAKYTQPIASSAVLEMGGCGKSVYYASKIGIQHASKARRWSRIFSLEKYILSSDTFTTSRKSDTPWTLDQIGQSLPVGIQQYPYYW
jgi:hypothetical protein